MNLKRVTCTFTLPWRLSHAVLGCTLWHYLNNYWQLHWDTILLKYQTVLVISHLLFFPEKMTPDLCRNSRNNSGLLWWGRFLVLLFHKFFLVADAMKWQINIRQRHFWGGRHFLVCSSLRGGVFLVSKRSYSVPQGCIISHFIGGTSFMWSLVDRSEAVLAQSTWFYQLWELLLFRRHTILLWVAGVHF